MFRSDLLAARARIAELERELERTRAGAEQEAAEKARRIAELERQLCAARTEERRKALRSGVRLLVGSIVVVLVVAALAGLGRSIELIPGCDCGCGRLLAGRMSLASGPGVVLGSSTRTPDLLLAFEDPDDDFEYYLGRFSTQDGGEVWRLGPFGEREEHTNRELMFSLAGGKVAVIDARARLHVFGLEDAGESGSLELTDHARRICAAPDGRPVVWIEVTDERHVLVDLADVTARASNAPAWAKPCDPFPGVARGPSTGMGSEVGSHRFEIAHRDPPETTGFRASFAIAEGSRAVALGHRAPGTPVPMAVGFDPARRTVRWKRVLPRSDPRAVQPQQLLAADLQGERVAVAYGLDDKHWRVALLRARDGRRIWDVPIPESWTGTPHVAGIRLLGQRVAVGQWSELALFDVRDGDLVAHIAHE